MVEQVPHLAQNEILAVLKEIRDCLKDQGNTLQELKNSYAAGAHNLLSELPAEPRPTGAITSIETPKRFIENDDETTFCERKNWKCAELGFPAPQSTFYVPLECPKKAPFPISYAPGHNFSPLSTSQPNFGTVAGPDWMYWRPIGKSPKHWKNFFPLAIGRPDYVPEWELKQLNGRWYHLDDTNGDFPVNPLWDDSRTVRSVPYSFVRSHHNNYGANPLPVDQEKLRAVLGPLWTIPFDCRYTLAFERSILADYTKEKATVYLGKAKSLFEKLDQAGGSFEITDMDDFGSSATYDLPSSVPDFRPALDAEEQWLTIDPSRVKLLKCNGEDGWARVIETHSSSPWHRLIHIQNLASAVTSVLSAEELEHKNIDKVWELFFTKTGSFYDAKWAFGLHLYCYPRPLQNPYMPHDDIFQIAMVGIDDSDHVTPPTFHVVYHRVVDPEDPLWRESTWKSGQLYGTDDLFIQQTAFTFQIGIDDAQAIDDGLSQVDENPLSTPHWTGVLLSPATFEIEDPDGHPSTFLRIIAEGLRGAADAWEVIVMYLDRSLQSSILDPEAHDQLLFDDETFSRSRLYFWYVDSIVLFQTQIQDAINQWVFFWSAKESELQALQDQMTTKFGTQQLDSDGTVMGEHVTIEESSRDVDFQCHRLRDLHARFVDLHSRAIALRDGLFNASSVIEAREATRLAENVKLLTYVTIFFLPLGFCVALWSMSDGFDKLSFAVTTAAVALGTYILVMNLNNLVGAIQSAYKKVRKDVLASMEKEKDNKWKDRGKGLGSYKPDRAKTTPSEWWVALYVAIGLGRQLRMIRHWRPSRKARTTEDEEKRGSGPKNDH
ncbi:hypothetical protein BU16DRAFT_586431 [Lophium mytilinum]|uniref:Cora-domain-containing protein n=1 Tax=Lophium mytilinum TaxID=390894 RepID=A0A6A6QCH7_9PEZI|nr:hypothetical protein BU16DRAFT_586431 [Lophium mytilinum]